MCSLNDMAECFPSQIHKSEVQMNTSNYVIGGLPL